MNKKISAKKSNKYYYGGENAVLVDLKKQGAIEIQDNTKFNKKYVELKSILKSK